jgi:excisionase family DNA binding protein
MTLHTTRPAPNPPAPEWLSLQQAALIYGISVDTLRRRISAGKLPASRFGARLIRVRIADLEQLYRPVAPVRPTLRRAW